LAPNRVDLNSKVICKARHQVSFTKSSTNVASGVVSAHRWMGASRREAVIVQTIRQAAFSKRKHGGVRGWSNPHSQHHYTDRPSHFITVGDGSMRFSQACIRTFVVAPQPSIVVEGRHAGAW
jgi:hypothetical protein